MSGVCVKSVIHCSGPFTRRRRTGAIHCLARCRRVCFKFSNLINNTFKAELLSEAIALLGSNLRLQRLYSEYEEMIEAKKLIDEEQQLMDEF